MNSDIGASGAKARPSWALRCALLMLAFGGLAVLYVLFAAASKPEPRGGIARFARGEMTRLEVLEDAPPPPGDVFRDAAGRETRLADFDNEVVVLNLWATWCAPCMEEMPTLGALQRRFDGRLRVIPISVDSVADQARARAELAELSESALPFFNDPSRAILFSARASGMPLTIIYDRRGRERARLAGGADWASPEAAALMEAVLAEE